ncbi:MAG: ABC transporter substrate-binding protein [Deltaproteobacteria bacterium]|nr:ABC transporter substrate-binding protein [Deltaproteobacteria bacterium]
MTLTPSFISRFCLAFSAWLTKFRLSNKAQASSPWPAALSFLALCFSLPVILVPGAWAAESLPGEKEILLGMSTALTGPAAVIGLEMKTGVETALHEINQTGGIRGRRLRLIAIDDGYEPSRTAPNMRRLINVENVLAIIGNVGTPTAVVAVPIANAGKTPFLCAFSGGGILRKTPPDRYVVNYRAGYTEEVSAMITALITNAGLHPEEIAFFTQRDAYGDAGFAGGVAALRGYGLQHDRDVLHGRYERNTLAVENGLTDIIQSGRNPKAVIMVGTYAPCAEFIRLAGRIDLKAVLLNVSFVARPISQRSMAAQMEKEATSLAKPFLFHSILMVFISGAALVNQHPIPLDWRIILS